MGKGLSRRQQQDGSTHALRQSKVCEVRQASAFHRGREGPAATARVWRLLPVLQPAWSADRLFRWHASGFCDEPGRTAGSGRVAAASNSEAGRQLINYWLHLFHLSSRQVLPNTKHQTLILKTTSPPSISLSKVFTKTSASVLPG